MDTVDPCRAIPGHAVEHHEDALTGEIGRNGDLSLEGVWRWRSGGLRSPSSGTGPASRARSGPALRGSWCGPGPASRAFLLRITHATYSRLNCTSP